jgi:hypothetical protein
MLIKTTFRFPDVFFGMLLAVAIFAIEMLFSSSFKATNGEGNQNQRTTLRRKNSPKSSIQIALGPGGFDRFLHFVDSWIHGRIGYRHSPPLGVHSPLGRSYEGHRFARPRGIHRHS